MSCTRFLLLSSSKIAFYTYHHYLYLVESRIFRLGWGSFPVQKSIGKTRRQLNMPHAYRKIHFHRKVNETNENKKKLLAMRCISSGAEFSLFFPSLSLLFLFFCVALSAQNVLHFHVIGTNSLNNKIIHVTTSKIFSTKRGWGTSVSFCVWQPIYTQLSISRVARRLHLLILRSISQLSHSLLEYKIFTLIAYL